MDNSATCMRLSVSVRGSKCVATAASLFHTDLLPAPSASTCYTCYITSVKAAAVIKLKGSARHFFSFWHECTRKCVFITTVADVRVCLIRMFRQNMISIFSISG